MVIYCASQMLGNPTPKCLLLRSTCKKKKYVLASGPRYCTKTVSCLLAVCDHAWQVDNGNIVLITVSQSAGIDSGVWTDLVDFVIPAYGLQFKKKPFIHPISKKPMCDVYNKSGKGVRIQLESLKDEADVEKRFKGKSYSMIYIPELSNFKLRKTFDVLAESLRGIGIKESQCLFLADTNPADEGEASWIFQLWYVLRGNDECEPQFKALREKLGLIEFQISDNVYASEERIEELKARYAHDPDLAARYLHGLWTTSTEDALFAKVFRPNIHVIGETPTAQNTDPELMIPDPGCYQLGGGWDMGITNSAFSLVEKTYREDMVKNFDGKIEPKVVSVFNVLDELVIINEDFEMREFVGGVMKKMRFWEDWIGKPIEWTHWSDLSAFDRKEPISNLYHHQLVFEESGGQIILQAAERGRGTVAQRINLFRRLLFQDRVHFSAHCIRHIAMCKSLKKGKGQFSIIHKESPHKHAFDSLTYFIASECFEELDELVWRHGRPNTSTEVTSGLVAVGL